MVYNTPHHMNYSEKDLLHFRTHVWEPGFSKNGGGMGAPDLFSLYFVLNKLKPRIVIESGVWNGISTKLIRKVLPDATILCLDPRDIPATGFKDVHPHTHYYVGKHFVDFKDLNVQQYDPKDIFCFFDCHQNAYLRLLQCQDKKITKVLLNDNYPVKCGSHFTIEQLLHTDNRHYTVAETDRTALLQTLETYHIFPNVFPGNITTMEGSFPCASFWTRTQKSPTLSPLLRIFQDERNTYRWNTFVQLTLPTSI